MGVRKNRNLSKIRCVISFIGGTLLTSPLLVGTYVFWESDKFKSIVCVALFLIGMSLNLFSLRTSWECAKYKKFFDEEERLEETGYSDSEIEKIMYEKFGEEYHEYDS